jgi:hypothetical protein
MAKRTSIVMSTVLWRLFVLTDAFTYGLLTLSRVVSTDHDTILAVLEDTAISGD